MQYQYLFCFKAHYGYNCDASVSEVKLLHTTGVKRLLYIVCLLKSVLVRHPYSVLLYYILGNDLYSDSLLLLSGWYQ